jgi:single-stranded DNA-binding protein
MKKETSNKVIFIGTVSSPLQLSHRVYAENFYCFDITVERLSGSFDTLPVIVSQRLLCNISQGSRVRLEGQLRSYNMITEGKNRLVIKIFARTIERVEDDICDENAVYLQGYVCKPPIFRTTPFSREISDVLLAINRSYGKSDYIPCICWGRNARYCSDMQVSQFLSVAGRLQSRMYQKHLPDGTVEERTAFEVSVSRLSTEPDELPLDLEDTF